MSRPPALAAYAALTRVLEPLAPALLRWRARRGKEDAARLNERLGRPILPRPPGPLVWLHGASVGEGLSLLPLIDALREARPELNVLVTSVTTTAADLLARRLPREALHQYAPLDTPRAVQGFLAHWQPDVAVFVESELWPNLLLAAKSQGARLALVSARLSARSARGWARTPRSISTLLGAFDLVLTQDEPSAQRLTALGARDDGWVNLKRVGKPLPFDAAALEAARAQAGDRPVLLAASTHPGEEAVALEAFARVVAPVTLDRDHVCHPDRSSAAPSAEPGRDSTDEQARTARQRRAGPPPEPSSTETNAPPFARLGPDGPSGRNGEDAFVPDLRAAQPRSVGDDKDRAAPAEFIGPLIVIVPRHPARGADVAALVRARGITCTLQSAREPFGAAPVHVADALGELGLWMRLARAVFLGGGNAPGVGGHNPLEPARLHLPVASGPHVDNWSEVFANLEGHGGVAWTSDAASLAAFWRAAIAGAPALTAQAERAHALTLYDDGALDATVAKLLALLP